MESTYKVKLGDKANIFHDPSSRVTVKKGEVVEITLSQARSKKIQAAFQGGFLVRVNEPASAPAAPAAPVESTIEKFHRLIEAGADEAKIAKSFKLDKLKEIAKEFDLEPEDDDTKETLVKAIFEEMGNTAEENSDEE